MATRLRRHLGEDGPVLGHRAAEEGDADALQALRLVAGHQGGGPGDLGQGADLVLAGAQQADVATTPDGGPSSVSRSSLPRRFDGMEDGDGGHGELLPGAGGELSGRGRAGAAGARSRSWPAPTACREGRAPAAPAAGMYRKSSRRAAIGTKAPVAPALAQVEVLEAAVAEGRDHQHADHQQRHAHHRLHDHADVARRLEGEGEQGADGQRRPAGVGRPTNQRLSTTRVCTLKRASRVAVQTMKKASSSQASGLKSRRPQRKASSAGRGAEGDDVGERVVLLAELALGAGHAGDPAVDAVEDGRQHDEAAAPGRSGGPARG